MATFSDPAGVEYVTIFRPYFTTKTGRRIYRGGGRMWPIRIRVIR